MVKLTPKPETLFPSNEPKRDTHFPAIATPLGEGGLAVIRLSGADAFVIADKCFQPSGKNSLKPSAAPTHTIQFGKIVRGENVIDEVMLAVLRAPRTFTREDTVEISCHGGLLPAKLVLDTLLAHGARPYSVPANSPNARF